MKKNTVRTTKINMTGKPPLICVPIISEDVGGLMEQAEAALKYGADLIEWRADGFEWSRPEPVLSTVMKQLKNAAGGKPVVFTCRINREGGITSIPEDMRLQLIERAVETEFVDIVDIELSVGPNVIKRFKKAVLRNDKKLILSFHDFKDMPKERTILDRLEEAQRLGADIAKAAVTTRDPKDMISLFNTVYRAKTGRVGIPIAVMDMGRFGPLSRAALGFFGSDMVYASGSVCSAPGQISVGELRSVWKCLYKNCDGRDPDDCSNERPCR